MKISWYLFNKCIKSMQKDARDAESVEECRRIQARINSFVSSVEIDGFQALVEEAVFDPKTNYTNPEDVDKLCDIISEFNLERVNESEGHQRKVGMLI